MKYVTLCCYIGEFPRSVKTLFFRRVVLKKLMNSPILNIFQKFQKEVLEKIWRHLSYLVESQISTRKYFSRTEISKHAACFDISVRSLCSNKPPCFVSKSRIGERSIQYKGSQIWKAMPTDLKNCETFPKFKTAYKKYLLENEIDATIFLNETDLLLYS